MAADTRQEPVSVLTGLGLVPANLPGGTWRFPGG
jgi:hypothetical protein